jgi:hypothetical protein
VGFKIAAYDPSKTLIIDPSLSYSTYLGGTADESNASVAVDATGNAFVTGLTSSTDFPTSSPLQAANAGKSDVFVAKLNAAGNALVYCTYLGGSDDEAANSIAVDAAGGMTCSITPALDCGLGTTSVVPGPDPSSPSVFALGIVTVGNSARLSPKSRNHGIVACSFLVLPGIAFCIAGFWQDKSQKRVPYQRVVIVLLMFLALQPACGGEGGRGSGGGSQHHGTPAGTYQITMTGVSGAIQHSATASLVVQ